MSRFTKYFARNNIKSTLFLSISQSATSIQVQSGEGERFGNEFPFYATLEAVDSGKVVKREIIKATARNGDILTVERAVAPCPASDDDNTQGQTAFDFNAGDSISIYITADIVNAIQNSLNDLYDNGNDRLYVKSTGGLNISVSGGNVRFNNAEHYYNGGTAVLTDNATNYVMLDGTDNIVVSTEAFDNSMISLAEVVVASGSVVSITPRKIDSRTGDLGGGGSLLYGDGSDGEMVISENTVLNAGYLYQFTNLTICPGVVVSFSGDGGGRIKVNNTFINCGTIDMTDLDVKKGCYVEEDYKQMLCNCAGFEFVPGQGGMGGGATKFYLCNYMTQFCIGEYSCGRGGKGGDAIPNCNCTCVGCGGIAGYLSYGCPIDGGDGFNQGGGGGAGGCACNSGTSCKNGCPGNGLNGGNGGYSNYGGGGGGGGGFLTGNGGNGGDGFFSKDMGSCAYLYWNGGDGGNGGILGNGGNGGASTGIGGKGGDGICGGNGGCGYFMGGDGGNGFYGGNGGILYRGNCYSYKGGKGGDGVIPGDGGIVCGTQGGGFRGGDGGNGISALHSLELKVCNFCNCGCILSQGAVGGRGGGNCNTNDSYYIGLGGRGGQGGTIMLVVDCMLEYGCIDNRGGKGGLSGGTCAHGPNGLPGCLIYFCGCKG